MRIRLKGWMGSLLLGIATLASAAGAHAADIAAAGSSAEQRQRLALQVAQRTAPIHSAEQLAAYLQRIPAHSPLEPLSQWGRDRFLGSLRFNESGLTTYDYQPLVEELTASQAARLLALFGAARTLSRLPGLRAVSEDDLDAMVLADGLDPVFGDHQDYRCSDRATCVKSDSFICMSGC